MVLSQRATQAVANILIGSYEARRNNVKCSVIEGKKEKKKNKKKKEKPKKYTIKILLKEFKSFFGLVLNVDRIEFDDLWYHIY